MPHSSRVQKAVFPVAGLGTRFLPATKASPKEMLPIVDKPLIQYAVEEAYAAGIRHMIFVTGRSKRAIEDHFDTAYELEAELEAAGKDELLALVRSVQPSDMDCAFVRQPRSLGLGHAVLCAEPLVGREPFAVLLADDLMVGPPGGAPVLAQMMSAFRQQGRSVIAVQEVPADQVHRYGIVAGESAGGPLIRIERIVENPRPPTRPRAWAWRAATSSRPACSRKSASNRAAWAARSSSPTASPDSSRKRPFTLTNTAASATIAEAKRAFWRPPWSLPCSTRRWAHRFANTCAISHSENVHGGRGMRENHFCSRQHFHTCSIPFPPLATSKVNPPCATKPAIAPTAARR